MGPSFHLGRKNNRYYLASRNGNLWTGIPINIGNSLPENEINQTRNVQSTGTAIFFVTLKKKFDHSEIVFNLYTKNNPNLS